MLLSLLSQSAFQRTYGHTKMSTIVAALSKRVECAETIPIRRALSITKKERAQKPAMEASSKCIQAAERGLAISTQKDATHSLKTIDSLKIAPVKKCSR